VKKETAQGADDASKVASVSDARYLRRLATLIYSHLSKNHVTVGEALMLIDQLVRPTVGTRRLDAPPFNPADGERWIVGATPTGAWAGKASQIAMWIDGTWSFLQPKLGRTIILEDEQVPVTWSEGIWRERSGDGTLNPPIRFAALENALTLRGAFVEAALPAIIADRIIPLAVTSHTIERIVGTFSYALGFAGNPTQFGTSLGIAPGSSHIAIVDPNDFNAATPIRVIASGGNFVAGKVLLSYYALALTPPIL